MKPVKHHVPSVTWEALHRGARISTVVPRCQHWVWHTGRVSCLHELKVKRIHARMLMDGNSSKLNYFLFFFFNFSALADFPILNIYSSVTDKNNYGPRKSKTYMLRTIKH